MHPYKPDSNLVPCPACQGKCVIENHLGEFKVCPICHGSGEVPRNRPLADEVWKPHWQRQTGLKPIYGDTDGRVILMSTPFSKLSKFTKEYLSMPKETKGAHVFSTETPKPRSRGEK